MIKYYTKAWQDECVRRMANPEFEQKIKKFNGTFVFRIYDGPDGKDRTMHWTFKQGKLTDALYQAQPAPWDTLRNTPFSSAWTMRATCPYSMMSALNRGDMSPMKALTSPQYKVEGNKVMLMQLMLQFQAWNQLCASVEVTYEYTSEEDTESVQTETSVAGDVSAEAASSEG